MKVIILAAGLGTRFVGTLAGQDFNSYGAKGVPKAILKTQEGKTLAHWSYSSFSFWITNGVVKPSDFYFVIQREHEKEFRISDLIRESTHKMVNFIVLDNLTRGPAESALQALKQLHSTIGDSGVVISDCDHFFSTSSLLRILTSKHFENHFEVLCGITHPPVGLPKWSYALADSTSSNPFLFSVKEIAEKDANLAQRGAFGVVGCTFFKDIKSFCRIYDETFSIDYQKERYISALVSSQVDCGASVFAYFTEEAFPLGTAEDISEFQKVPTDLKAKVNRPNTYFVDLDGVLVQHDSGIHSDTERFTYPSSPHQKSIYEIRKEFWLGSRIVITTSRPSSEKNDVESELCRLGIPFDELLLGMGDGVRVVINDRKPKVSHLDTALALNLMRDFDELYPVSSSFHQGLKIVENLSSGSNASVLKLESHNGSLKIRKLVPVSKHSRSQVEVLRMQERWYGLVSQVLPDSVPKVYGSGFKDGFYFLDMEDLSHARDLSFTLKENNRATLFKCLTTLFASLDRIYNIYKLEINTKASVVLQKIINDRAIVGIKTFYSTKQAGVLLLNEREFITINNQTYRNPVLTLNEISESRFMEEKLKKLDRLFGSKRLIHGDLTAENVLVTPSPGSSNVRLTFLDPLAGKQDLESQEIPGGQMSLASPIFDWIKLMQSFYINYETWNSRSDVATIASNGDVLFRSELSNPDNETVAQINNQFFGRFQEIEEPILELLLALLLFRIVPYKVIDSIEKALYCFSLATTLLDRSKKYVLL